MENPPVADAILWVELCIIVLMALALGNLKWSIRAPLATLLGWPVLAVGTSIFWSVLFESARTPAEMEYVAAHDGAPVAFAALFGWAYVLGVVLAVELVRGLAGLAWRIRSDR
jgi:hypothetical protein